MVYVYEYVIKIEQTLKNYEIWGSKGELSETQITLHVQIEFVCTFSKVITGHEKTTPDSLKSMLILTWWDNFLSFSNKTSVIYLNPMVLSGVAPKSAFFTRLFW